MSDPMPAIRKIVGMPADAPTASSPEWDGNGWRNGHPADDTDYKKEARDAAFRGDFVRANYFATLLLERTQRALVEQQRVANLIAFHAGKFADAKTAEALWKDIASSLRPAS